ncbi:hypothetical protein D6833_02940 [Candidatus Parcubacteria bacterium]|nr:MAG: hypothetical protein D6833_02940 [Candidatus Parcubacteria bacterium]
MKRHERARFAGLLAPAEFVRPKVFGTSKTTSRGGQEVSTWFTITCVVCMETYYMYMPPLMNVELMEKYNVGKCNSRSDVLEQVAYRDGWRIISSDEFEGWACPMCVEMLSEEDDVVIHAIQGRNRPRARYVRKEYA